MWPKLGKKLSEWLHRLVAVRSGSGRALSGQPSERTPTLVADHYGHPLRQTMALHYWQLMTQSTCFIIICIPSCSFVNGAWTVMHAVWSYHSVMLLRSDNLVRATSSGSHSAQEPRCIGIICGLSFWIGWLTSGVIVGLTI